MAAYKLSGGSTNEDIQDADIIAATERDGIPPAECNQMIESTYSEGILRRGSMLYYSRLTARGAQEARDLLR